MWIGFAFAFALSPTKVFPSTKKNKQVRKLQGEIEAIKQDIGSKRKSAALDHVKTVKRLLGDANLPKPCRDPKFCAAVIEKIGAEVEPATNGLKDSLDSQNGSDQERQALDKAYAAQERMSKLLTTLEENMVPKDYEVKVPDAYKDLPQLKKRATVEMVFKKPNNEPFDVNGQNFAEAKMKMVIDGYTGMCCVQILMGANLDGWKSMHLLWKL